MDLPTSEEDEMDIRYGTWAVHGELTEHFDRAVQRRQTRRQRRRTHRRRAS